MTISDALNKLDSNNDNHWTAGGFPLVSAVSEILGREVTRQEIIDANPEFMRSSNASDPEKPESLALEESIESQIKELDKKISDAEALMREAQLERDGLRRERAKLTAQVRREYDAQKDQERRMAFIRRQNEEREKRYAKTSKALQGVNPADLNPKSPIDSAMARKRGYGKDRPVRELKV